MNLGQFREQTKDLPDNTEILGECAEELKYNDMEIQFILPETKTKVPCILLEGGQIWNYELALDQRIDAYLDSHQIVN